jgi:hypothetical protein
LKAAVVYVLLLASVVIATIAFRNKVNSTENEIGQFQKSVRGASAFLPPKAIISFKATEKPVELLIWTRDALFPRRIDRIEETVQHDTTLLIIPHNSEDSLKTQILNTDRIIWQLKDERYEYYLFHAEN